MPNDEQDYADRRRIADVRFAVIAPMVQGIISTSNAEYARNMAQNAFPMPDGTKRYYSAKTILRWYSDYTRGGMEALMPRTRGDKGATRVLPEDAQAKIQELRKQFPRMKAPVIRDRLIDDELIGGEVSLSTIQRFIRNNPLQTLVEEAQSQRERRAFEMEKPNILWQADTAYFPPIRIHGRTVRTYFIAIIDDFSRLITSGQLVLHDNSLAFQCVLRDAIQTYGIPTKLLTDNGAPYSNEQLTYICGDLGIVHISARPRDPQTKGKIERVMRTFRTRFLSGFDVETVPSFEEYQELVREWVRTYNTTIHSSIGTTPQARFLENAQTLRRPLSAQWLDDCFMNRAVRLVRRDSTFTLNGVLYDAPMQFVGQKAEIHFSPDNPDEVWIVLGSERFPAHPTDKIANGKARRHDPSRPSVNYALEVQDND